MSAHSWIPASEIAGASRSPCPLLNTLANHGNLPRDGKDILVRDFVSAVMHGGNFDEALALRMATTNFKLLGLTATSDPTTNTTTHLENRNNHTSGDDHDASLTRLDYLQYLDTVTIDHDSFNISSLARSRLRREMESLAMGSPPLAPLATQAGGSEAALTPLVFGDGGASTSGNISGTAGEGDPGWDPRRASKDIVKEWFLTERFTRS